MAKNPLAGKSKKPQLAPQNKPPKAKKPKLPKPTQNVTTYKPKSVSIPKAKKAKPPKVDKRKAQKNDTARRKVLSRIDKWVQKGYTFNQSVYDKIAGATADEIKAQFGGAKLNAYFETKPPKAPKEKVKNPPKISYKRIKNKERTAYEKANNPPKKKPKKISYDRIKKKERKEAEIELQKERARVNARIRRLQKRGYYFDTDEIAHLRGLTLDELKEKFGRDTVYNQAIWINKDTNEVIQGTTRRQMERREAARKAAETRSKKKGRNFLPHEEDIIIGNFHAGISAMVRPIKEQLHAIVDSAVDENGKQAVARAITRHIDELRQIMLELEESPKPWVTEWVRRQGTAITRFISDIYDRALTSEELRQAGRLEEQSEVEFNTIVGDYDFDEYDDE